MRAKLSSSLRDIIEETFGKYSLYVFEVHLLLGCIVRTSKCLWHYEKWKNLTSEIVPLQVQLMFHSIHKNMSNKLTLKSAPKKSFLLLLCLYVKVLEHGSMVLVQTTHFKPQNWFAATEQFANCKLGKSSPERNTNRGWDTIFILFSFKREYRTMQTNECESIKFPVIWIWNRIQTCPGNPLNCKENFSSDQMEHSDFHPWRQSSYE